MSLNICLFIVLSFISVGSANDCFFSKAVLLVFYIILGNRGSLDVETTVAYRQMYFKPTSYSHGTTKFKYKRKESIDNKLLRGKK